MKISVKVEDEKQHHKIVNPLITAKIPISILNHPFLTSISTNSLSSDLSFALSSNFSSGPSLKLSYSPISTQNSFPPISLCLKSGLGFFGSPNNSPLVFKAYFSFSSQNPTFSLHLKPQFGNFALKKAAFSNPRGGAVCGSGSKPKIEAVAGSGQGGSVVVGNGFSSEGTSVWQEMKLEPCGSGGGLNDNCERLLGSKGAEKDGFLSGIAVMARTVFPVSKKFVVNMRWGVNLPSDLGAKMPYLTMNKFGVERVDNENEFKEERRNNVNGESGNVRDLELLKGMCFWMTRDLETMERENRQMKHNLEEMSKLKRSLRSNSVPEVTVDGSSSGFERWKSRKNVKEESVRREVKKPSNQGNDLEAELQKAIKAAASTGYST